jgi:hypothetical protein
MGMSVAVLGISAYAKDAGIHDDIIGLCAGLILGTVVGIGLVLVRAFFRGARRDLGWSPRDVVLAVWDIAHDRQPRRLS